MPASTPPVMMAVARFLMLWLCPNSLKTLPRSPLLLMKDTPTWLDSASTPALTAPPATVPARVLAPPAAPAAVLAATLAAGNGAPATITATSAALTGPIPLCRYAHCSCASCTRCHCTLSASFGSLVICSTQAMPGCLASSSSFTFSPTCARMPPWAWMRVLPVTLSWV